MDANVQRILDEMQKMEKRQETRFTDLELSLTGASQKFDERLDALEAATTKFAEWRPSIESTVDTVRSEVGMIRKHMERTVLESSSASPGILPSPHPVKQPIPQASPGLPGHADIGSAHGSVFAHVHDKGMSSKIPSPSQRWLLHSSDDQHTHAHHTGSTRVGRLPKLLFPQFDGENPKLWISRCENYFDLYAVESEMWIRVAIMHCSGPAARWIQSVESRLRRCSWNEFCVLLLTRFGKDEHELLLRQLIHVSHMGSVADYIAQFTELVDQLAAYESSMDSRYYTTKFIEGLQPSIRSAVLLHRPQDLDTACALAALHEEVTDPARYRGVKQSAFSPFTQPSPKGPHSLPLPPRIDKPHIIPPDKKLQAVAPSAPPDKMAALKAYRKAQGLCFRCADKWAPGHKCSPTVQLHVVQELWELFQLSSDEPDESSLLTEDKPQLFMALSTAAANGQYPTTTLKFRGTLSGQNILILVDSGSTHTFVSSAIAAQIPDVIAVHNPLVVQVANGNQMICRSELNNATWSVQGVSFCSNMKILPLTSYDLIVGMDWLETLSPMHIHWAQKWIQFYFQGQSIILQGELPPNYELTVLELSVLVDDPQDSVIPPCIRPLLDTYAAVFDAPKGLPPSRSFDHAIPLIAGAQPFVIRPYRYPPTLKSEIENQVTQMLSDGIIRPSSSPFSSSVVMTKKKDGSWRFCIDYRFLNALTIKSKFPIPIIDEFLDELSHACWFTKLDLRSGFHQILLQAGEEHKTAFTTHLGQYEFLVMPFGVTGGPGTFQKAMNVTLSPVLRLFALVFLDDILIYSSTLEDHLSHIEAVLQLLAQDSWKVKPSKCTFAQQSIAYLGYVISAGQVSTDPAKIAAVLAWPSPSNVKELRSFLGLSGYYRKFVRHYGILSKPLTQLLRKNIVFVWTSETEATFQALKAALVSAPVLALPDFQAQFCIETDASESGIGAVLTQKGHPLAFVSKALGPKTKGLSTYEKEYMAIILAVEQWRAYLQYTEFLIYTDHKSLAQLNTQRLHTTWQQKVFTKLLGFQYQVVYKKGVDNGAADALSRHPSPPAQLAAISSSVPQWATALTTAYATDPSAQDLLVQLSVAQTPVGHYTLHQGLIKYKGRLWLGSYTSIHQQIFHALHSSAIGGHSGFPVTYRRIKQLFYWPGMKSMIHKWVQSCQVCNQAKPDRSLTVAHAFMDNIYKLHGMPQSIISDRDRVFTSTLWRELFRLSALNQTPFQTLYGHAPRHFGIVPDTVGPVQDLSDWLSQRNLMNDIIRQQLNRAQVRMKHQADKRRSERSFDVGDSVYLKLQPYVQSSVARRSNNKLSYKFFGPFEIEAKIGAVAYKLKLPPSSAIHPVFHVSQLKKAPPADQSVSSALPDADLSMQIPIQVLQHRVITRGDDVITQGLVRWSDMPDDLATWEDLEPLQQRFPHAPAWSQAGFQGRRNVTGSVSATSPMTSKAQDQNTTGSS
ncbi:hypothetical protein U9M48_037412 [Paspalum notatum var. saurae]|uniref:Reverse transcriptase domain-containing protein n=1 Tax=Paspalum notatum var. saurae TaxID=547442 RepID=A0AAQ3UL58_PASNO